MRKFEAVVSGMLAIAAQTLVVGALFAF